MLIQPFLTDMLMSLCQVRVLGLRKDCVRQHVLNILLSRKLGSEVGHHIQEHYRKFLQQAEKKVSGESPVHVKQHLPALVEKNFSAFEYGLRDQDG